MSESPIKDLLVLVVSFVARVVAEFFLGIWKKKQQEPLQKPTDPKTRKPARKKSRELKVSSKKRSRGNSKS